MFAYANMMHDITFSRKRISQIINICITAAETSLQSAFINTSTFITTSSTSNGEEFQEIIRFTKFLHCAMKSEADLCKYAHVEAHLRDG
ncbi:hypothetical protein SNEBB_008380 [Seison nebaliae]|nr:hypothetical protein SNEBB_008380 [Seison nebaliae]